MKSKIFFSTLFFLSILFYVSHSQSLKEDSKTNNEKNGIPLSQYADRRDKIIKAMDSNSVAIILSAQQKHRNSDVDYRYRQDNSLWYLTGFPEDRAALVLLKNKILVNRDSTEEILFVKERNPMFETWVGPSFGPDTARREFGIKAARSMKGFKAFIDSLLPKMSTIYYSSNAQSFISDPVTGYQLNLDKELKKEIGKKYPDIKVKSIQNEVSKLRGIKSEEEIALIQKAIDATTTAHIEAMKSCTPDMHEYDLQAIIEYCFTRLGAEYIGFPSIIGSGLNSTILHYENNRRQMKDGDVVVMDIGAEYHGYSADVTRTIPVNGKFSSEQKEIYSIVLKAQEEAIKKIRPGAKFSEIQEAVSKVMNDAGYGKYLNHGVSHHIGLDVHDVGSMNILAPGMVLTIEPGLYFPAGSNVDRKYWNIGVRIEDDVLVTENGNIVLSEKAPRSIEEIENLMRKEGIGNQKIGER